MGKDIRKALSVLKNGGIIAHATDTCYGFACDALNRGALVHLYTLKKMPRSKPVSIMVADLKMARRYGFFNKNAEKMAKKYWPGALTIIVKRKKSLPDFLNPDSKTIGIRVPDHKLSKELVKNLKRPLTTTSANISGLPSPYSVAAIKRQFGRGKLKPDLIINAGRIKRNPPSTIVDYTTRDPKIIRHLNYEYKNYPISTKNRKRKS